MSELIVIAYPDEDRAEQVLATLRQMQMASLIGLDAAVYVTKDAEGELKLHRPNRLTGMGAAGPTFSVGLMDQLLLAPTGEGLGSRSGTHSDYGLDDELVKQLGATMRPSSSAIFVLVHSTTPEEIQPEVSQHGGIVLRTSLASDDETRLQATPIQVAVERVSQATAAAEQATAAERIIEQAAAEQEARAKEAAAQAIAAQAAAERAVEARMEAERAAAKHAAIAKIVSEQATAARAAADQAARDAGLSVAYRLRRLTVLADPECSADA